MIELVTSRIIKSGNVIEVFHYEKGYLKGFTNPERKSMGRIKDYESEESEANREKSLNRAKANLRRLINANHGQYGDHVSSKFLTLTFGENVTDIEVANYEFKKFMQRLNYKLFDSKKANLKYVVVPEKQQRGAIHYHVVLFNVPFVDSGLLAEIWGNGFIKINKIDNVDNVGAYISAYLGKEDDVHGDWLKGKKSYFSSRGLLKPQEITDIKKVEQVASALPLEKISYSAKFSNEHLGNISYLQYNLNKEY